MNRTDFLILNVLPGWAVVVHIPSGIFETLPANEAESLIQETIKAVNG